jgi:hypothetical protein
MKHNHHRWIISLVVVSVVGIITLSLVPRMTSESAVSSCNDPINCKKPVYVGSNGRCTCFTCEDGTFVCTDKPKDKLELFEAEAQHRDTEGVIRSLPKAQRVRLKELGIDPNFRDDLDRFDSKNTNDNRPPVNRDTDKLDKRPPVYNPVDRANVNTGPQKPTRPLPSPEP